ncbi:MAG: hypothetical protein IID39_08545 [Planctomycetes bacterium]|nr:hypothetical protein [Planctomycetota bacterium]
MHRDGPAGRAFREFSDLAIPGIEESDGCRMEKVLSIRDSLRRNQYDVDGVFAQIFERLAGDDTSTRRARSAPDDLHDLRNSVID